MQTLTPTNPLMEPVFPMNIRHQLVIIGNGFDLACGLDSSFRSFFLPRFDAIRAVDPANPDEWFKGLRASDLTAWDLILQSRKDLADRGFDVNWCDVETVVSEVIEVPAATHAQCRKSTASSTQIVSVNSILKYFDFYVEFEWHGSPRQFVAEFEKQVDNDYKRLMAEFECMLEGGEAKSKIAQACKKLIRDEPSYSVDCYACLEIAEKACPNEASEQIAQYLERRFPAVSRWDANAIREALLQELHVLERAFGEHLSREVASKPSYDASASALLGEILEVDGDDLMDMAAEVTVLDFNYTTPLVPDLGFEDDPQVVNVHGSLGGALIFGADGTNCLSDSGAVRFTKTYRVLEQKRQSLRGSIAYAPCDGHLGSKETVAIKIYGHSLAQADYSYFQSVFDIVDLYSGSVKLYFLYREFKQTAREDLLLRVANLLNAYGASMDNQDHGKNLMHKLLLEGRLILQKVE